VSLPLSATWDFRYADRLRRAAARVRTYLRFRRDPGFHQHLKDEVAWLRGEAIALDALLVPMRAADSAMVQRLSGETDALGRSVDRAWT
jgi:hypothetical protein